MNRESRDEDRSARLSAVAVAGGLLFALSSPGTAQGIEPVPACPLTGNPYGLERKGGAVEVVCPDHSTTKGLLTSMRSPYRLEQEKRWHEDNAVVFAATLWARRKTRPLCYENARRFRAALQAFRKAKGSYPRGNALDAAHEVIAAGHYPKKRAPFCPQDGRPLRVEGLDGAAMLRIGCPNHGWLP